MLRCGCRRSNHERRVKWLLPVWTPSGHGEDRPQNMRQASMKLRGGRTS
jgi:hypothetical protein